VEIGGVKVGTPRLFDYAVSLVVGGEGLTFVLATKEPDSVTPSDSCK